MYQAPLEILNTPFRQPTCIEMLDGVYMELLRECSEFGANNCAYTRGEPV